MTHRHYSYYWHRCRECGQPAADYEYCEECRDRIDREAAEATAQEAESPDLKECDCCGQRKPDVELIWCDSVGDTYACPKCRGWEDD
jgi:hypothetical protein